MKISSQKEASRGFLFLYGTSLTWGGLLLALLVSVGCASIDGSDFRQVVYVKSSPPGAVVFQNGERIGVTPGYMKVKRGLSPELTLHYPTQQPRRLRLTTHYRWSDSFAANLIEYIFAPVGWTVDLLTGTAWRMDDPPEQEWDVKAAPFADAIHSVAIAPPLAKDPDVADAMGNLSETRLRENTKYHIIPYDQTEPLFTYYGSDQGLSENQNQRYRLYYESNADHIFLSQVIPKEGGYAINGRLKSIYTGVESNQVSWEVTPSEGQVIAEISTHSIFEKYFHILPNTVFVNFAAFNAANYTTTLEIDGTSFKGNSINGQSSFERMLDYVSSLSFAHLERPRTRVNPHWVFDFVPTINLSQRRIAYDAYAPLTGVQFDRWYVSGGYGIEVGHLSRFGFFYLDVIPSLTWTQITFQTPDLDERISNTSLTVMTEIGYTYFLTRHLVGKIYTRNLPEDSTLWEHALNDITGRSNTVTSAGSLQAGIAIGYYIPTSIKGKSGWKVEEKR